MDPKNPLNTQLSINPDNRFKNLTRCSSGSRKVQRYRVHRDAKGFSQAISSANRWTVSGINWAVLVQMLRPPVSRSVTNPTRILLYLVRQHMPWQPSPCQVGKLIENRPAKKSRPEYGTAKRSYTYNIEHLDLNAEWEWCSKTNASPQHRYGLTFQKKLHKKFYYKSRYAIIAVAVMLEANNHRAWGRVS